MARKRYITTEISTDKKLNRMGAHYGDGAQLFYLMLIPHADDQGTVTGDPYELLGLVWGGRRDKTEEDVVQALTACVEFHLIFWEPGASHIYFPVKTWYKYQSYVKQESRRINDPPSLPTVAENSGNTFSPPTTAEKRVSFPPTSPSTDPITREVEDSLRSSSPPEKTSVDVENSVENSEKANEIATSPPTAIQELTEVYHAMTEKTMHLTSDWAYMGQIYQACGMEAVMEGLQALQKKMAHEVVKRPLAYVGTVARRAMTRPNHRSRDHPQSSVVGSEAWYNALPDGPDSWAVLRQDMQENQEGGAR